MTAIHAFIKVIPILVVTAMAGSTSHAQSLSGKVVEWDDGKKKELPLAGANVYWMNTTTGVSANGDGDFQINLPEALPVNLIVSFVGYQNDTLRITDASFRKIRLKKSVDLKEVEVSVRQNATLISTINPINVEHVTGRELLKAACCNLSESFETNPTVNVAYKDAVTGAKEIQMLGLAGVYSQLLTENIPNMRGIAGIYGLTFIPGPWMDGIQITKGSGSVLNGFESTTGQINIEFKKPNDEKVPKFYLDLFGEENGNMEVNSFYRKVLNKHWSTILMTHANYMNTTIDRNDDGFFDMPHAKQINLYNRWHYDSGKRLESQLGVKYLYDRREGGQISADAGSHHASQYVTDIVNQRAEVFGKLGIVFPEHPAKSIGNIFQATYHDLNASIGLKTYKATEKNLYYEGIYQNIIGSTNHQYKTGITLLYDQLDDLYNSSHLFSEEFVPGVFAEYTYSFLEKIKIIAGMRLDEHENYGLVFIPRLHGKYNFTEDFIFRFSGGKSFRTPYAIADNISVLASSKQVIFQERTRPEEAWNYGVNFTRRWELNRREGSLSVDFYRTDFMNQLVVDQYSDTTNILFYNLDGKSWSNSFQATLNQDVLDDFGVRLAYKIDDVKTTYNKVLAQKPLVAKNRALLNLFFYTPNQHWKFDYTVVWEGNKKLANTPADPELGKLPPESPDFFVMHFQVTKKFKRFEMYGGTENLLDFRQKNPIINPQNPFSNSFDATQVWGPIEGRRVYAGLRFKFN